MRLHITQAPVRHLRHVTVKGCFGSTLCRGGMNSPQSGLGQNILACHGVLNCTTALRNVCWFSRVRMDWTMLPGMGCVQHRGGILDSSVVAWLTMTLRQCAQYVCPHGRLCRSAGWSLLLLYSSLQQTQDL